MQLILLLLLLMSGPSAIKDVKPLLEGVAGADAAKMLEEVEGLADIASAFNFANGGGTPVADVPPPQSDKQDFFPLAPIAGIADEGITYSLSRYISTGE